MREWQQITVVLTLHLNSSEPLLATMQGFTQWPTYPQLLVNGELLGGCDIIMEMQQDGSLKTAVQEALGVQLDTRTAVQQRIKQLLDSKPVMLFMKVSCCADALQFCHFAKSVCARTGRKQRTVQHTASMNAIPTKCMQANSLARTHQ